MQKTNRRWCPTLPSIGGRLGPRVTLPDRMVGESYLSLLEWFYLERISSPSIFIKKVDHAWLRKHGYTAHLGCYLNQLPGEVAFRYLLGGLPTMSSHFCRKLSELCLSGKLNVIHQWYHTVDGLVLPLLLTEEFPDHHYDLIDRLIKFGFENCANNYSRFISRMKLLKKLIRKDYACMTSHADKMADVATYRKIAKSYIYRSDDDRVQVEILLTWCQSRATGLADSGMVRKSLDKAEKTLSTTIATRAVVPRVELGSVCRRVRSNLRAGTAHLSAGPHACFERSQAKGGQTAAIKALCKGPFLRRFFDWRTLEPTDLEVARPCKSSADLLNWAIDQALSSPTYVRSVRLTAVPEPSKARTVTVATLPYQLIVGAIAKLFQPAIVSGISRTGLQSSRNLYEFLNQDLSPVNSLWANVRPDRKQPRTYALSSDLEEATDYGDPAVARQILHGLIQESASIEGFPTGLAVLAKTLFCGRRLVWRHYDGKGYRFFWKNRGWLMGDRLTKVVLTLAHEIGVRRAALPVARICGDDVLALSKDRQSLEAYHSVMSDLGFKISEDDHFISDKILFYCEEGSLVPQNAKELPAVANRRSVHSCYVDYPRIRLLISVKVQTLAPSYTDIGRFSLLGKECRWVHQNGDQRTIDLFARASLIQHLLVGQPADTMCPYIPHELGGDGAFPHTAEFLDKVLKQKARNPSEVGYRIRHLMKGTWGFKYVRSDHLDNVITKYHVMLPKVEILRELLPRTCVIPGNEKLLGSLKVPGLSSPEKVFLRTFRTYYWYCILNGLPEPSIDFDRDKLAHHCGGKGAPLRMDETRRFFLTWRDSGFTFRDNPSYLIDEECLPPILDHLNLGLEFGRTDPEPADNTLGIIQKSHIREFIESLKRGSDPPPTVKERLSLFVEADTYLLHQIAGWWDYPPQLLLISGDKRLAADCMRLVVERFHLETSDDFMIFMIHPRDYLHGLMAPYEDRWPMSRTLVDFGAVNYSAFTEDPTFPDFDAEYVKVVPVRIRGRLQPGIYHAELVGTSTGAVWSLTTQSLSTFLDRRSYVYPGILGVESELP